MEDKTLFDFNGYMRKACRKNRLAVRNAFHPCTCSGIQYLEGMVSGLRHVANFFCVSDVSEGSTVCRSGGFFRRRVFTVYILSRFKVNDTDDQEGKMNLCRELFRQFHSKLLRDEAKLDNEMIYLNVGDIRSRDIGGMFLTGCTGLYFMVSVDEPVNLCYDEDEWME